MTEEENTIANQEQLEVANEENGENVENLYVVPNEDYDKKENDLISDKEWGEWVNSLIEFLDKYKHAFKTMEFLLEVKKKGDDCSRTYTGMWTLDMLHEAAKKDRQHLGAQFELDLVDKLQKPWNQIMHNIRDARKELLGTKCIDFFFAEYKESSKVITRDQLQTKGENNADRWMFLTKHCYELGLTKYKPYQDFLGKIMIEMVKY